MIETGCGVALYFLFPLELLSSCDGVQVAAAEQEEPLGFAHTSSLPSVSLDHSQVHKTSCKASASTKLRLQVENVTGHLNEDRGA